MEISMCGGCMMMEVMHDTFFSSCFIFFLYCHLFSCFIIFLPVDRCLLVSVKKQGVLMTKH